MKRFITLLIVSLLAFTPVFADNTEEVERRIDIESRFTNIYTFHTDFDIDGMGKALLGASLDGHSGDSSRIVAKLQRFSSGTWSTIKTFSSTSTTTSCTLAKNYYVTSGYSYRVLYYGYIYNGPIILDHTNQVSAMRFY